MFRTSLPAADASSSSLRASVEDNLAHRLRPTATDGRREHGGFQGLFQEYRVRPTAPHSGYSVGIRLSALRKEAGGTLALSKPVKNNYPATSEEHLLMSVLA